MNNNRTQNNPPPLPTCNGQFLPLALEAELKSNLSLVSPEALQPVMIAKDI